MPPDVSPRVYVANFGRENYLWPACLARSTLAMLEDQDLYPFVVAGDKEGYVAYCLANRTTPRGTAPTLPVISRWFNLMPILSESEGDIWLHHDKEDLWWTMSRPGAPEVSLKPPHHSHPSRFEVYEIHKPANPWSNKNKKGARLLWKGLHPRARAFLFTEGTFQALSSDNSEYARALIDGTDLAPWHSRSAWKTKADTSKHGAVKSFDAKQRAYLQMAMTAFATAASSNGQQVQRTVKNKDFGFDSPQSMAALLDVVLEDQEGLCALTGLRLQFPGEQEDDELLCSLDRKDSSGHYTRDNIQVVCRFVNRWKSDGDDATFRRLVQVVRSTT
jgi:hypothetical protein